MAHVAATQWMDGTPAIPTNSPITHRRPCVKALDIREIRVLAICPPYSGTDSGL